MAGKAKAGAAAGVKADSGADLETALKKTLAKADPGSYVALQAFIPAGGDTGEKLEALRMALRGGTKLAVTTGFGPRYLHSTGQLHKGGPDNGIFIQVTDAPSKDFDVPETDHTFGRLIAAQAAGDFQALEQKKRRVLSVDLGRDAAKGLDKLEAAVKKAI
jgi:transaldolase/glucose-6-phosphate isomerase